LLTLALFLTVLLAVAIRPAPGRRRYVTGSIVLIGWWLAGCASVAAAQRYSAHHFVVSTTPVLAMPAVEVHALVAPALAGRLVAAPDGQERSADEPTLALRERATSWSVALVLAVAVFVATGAPASRRGWRQLSDFGTFHNRAETYRRSTSGQVFTVRAVTAFFTPPDAGAWAWNNQPYWVGALDRVAGSRYIESRILGGYIYLGGQSDSYVPPNAWQHWADDLEQSKTVVVADTDDQPLPSEFAGKAYLDSRFRPAAEIGPWNLWVRRSHLDAIRPHRAGRSVTVAAKGTITVSTGRSCVEVRPAGTISVRMQAPSATGETAAIVFTGDRIWADHGSETAFQTLHGAVRPAGPSRVLVGRRSLVVLDGARIVTALVRPPGADDVVLSAGRAGLASSAEVADVLDCWGFA
jgi:hypothetical protein